MVELERVNIWRSYGTCVERFAVMDVLSAREGGQPLDQRSAMHWGLRA